MRVHFRAMRTSDLNEIRALHEEWFPVRYSYAFYEAAVRHRMVGTNEPLFTLVAEIDAGPRRQIIGLVTAQLTNTKGCGDEDTLFQPRANFTPHETSRVMYVLTLGSHSRYRRRGIARELLARCIARAHAEPPIGAVYLHVIAHNHAAIRFYRANRFQCLGEIADYYRIDGILYNCFVYAYYLDRAWTKNTPHRRPAMRLLASTLDIIVPPSLRSCFRNGPRLADCPPQGDFIDFPVRPALPSTPTPHDRRDPLASSSSA